MKIEKNLKYATFTYDEESKDFTITTKPFGESDGGHAVGGNTIKLNKIYSFAFMRFVMRIAQRNWLKNKKIVDNHIENELEYTEDKNQTFFEYL